MSRNKAEIALKIYDGTRQPFSRRQNLLLYVHNGQTTQPFTKTLSTALLNQGEITLNVDFFDNFADNYTVVVTAKGHRDAGFYPAKVSPKSPHTVSLMLIPSEPSFAFDPWEVVKTKHPEIAAFLCLSPGSANPQESYETNIEQRPRQLACLLNLATAMSQIFLAEGTPLEYFREIEWDTLAQDRFYGYALPELVSQVRAAVPEKLFVPEIDPGFFHGDATSSFKEIRFGEANVQLTFHENDTKKIGGDTCIRVEPDIDYYRDLAGHAILEVAYNTLTHSLTDPTQVYALRWMAGKQFGIPEFDPPYTLTE